MDEAHQVFVFADAKMCLDRRIVARPAGKPLRAKTEGLRALQEIEADGTRTEDLLDRGHARAIDGRSDHAQDQRRARKAFAVLGLCRFGLRRIDFHAALTNELAQAQSRIPGDGQNAPRGERAMIRHAHGECEQLFELLRRRAGLCQKA